MLLVLTASSDATADYLCKRFDAEDLPYVRMNTDECFDRVRLSFDVKIPRLRIGHLEITSSDIYNVWLRRPGEISIPIGFEPGERRHISAEWAEAVNGFLAHIPVERWVNHPAANALASHKMEQLSRAGEFGLIVPDTLVTQDAELFKRFFDAHGGDVITKPLASGYIERSNGSDEIIYTSQVQSCDNEALCLLAVCPTLVQSRIKKSVDVRVCVVDDCLTAVAISMFDASGAPELDVRIDNMKNAAYNPILVPPDERCHILALVRSYGLRFAAVDLAVDEDGNWVFFEINPNGQWAWLDIVGGFDIASTFLKAFGGKQ
jgi:hypothetical protein